MEAISRDYSGFENDFNEDYIISEIPENDISRYNDQLKSWLQFNYRVLHEAERSSNPIMERLNFIGIADSNLDEFIRTKFKLNKGLRTSISEQTKQIEAVYEKTLIELRDKYSIAIIHPSELRGDSKAYSKLKEMFKKSIYPLIQPLLLTNELPIPDIEDDGCFLVSRLETDNTEISGIIRLPDTKLIEIDVKYGNYKHIYCILEDIIEEFVGYFYRGSKIIWNKQFRVYRKIDSLYGQKSDNYLTSIKSQLSERKKSKVMLVDVKTDITGIEAVIGASKKRKRSYPHGLSYLKGIRDVIKYNDEMIYPKAKPRDPISFMNESMFDVLSNRDVLVHFPYEDFKMSTVRLLEEAAIDPNVKSIRQTLYRVSNESRLIKALITAAKNGKQVVVLLELKAKMDEQHNIELTEKLRSAGCNIIFGPIEMKTHAKVTLIVREEAGKLAKYCNIATGNFNESTAKIYEDLSYFCKDRKKFKVGDALLNLFNYLGGCCVLDSTNNLLISPHTFRSTINSEFDKCIEFKKQNPDKDVTITIKCNSFTDKEMCDRLYEASKEGIKVNCIIRGMCMIRAGVPNLSENINVISIVGRYLEHSRIYQFARDNNISTYIGSGDLMPRNLDHRVEVLVPIMTKNVQAEITSILDNYFKDTTNSYVLSDDVYSNPKIENTISIGENTDNPTETHNNIESFSIQQFYIDHYKKLEKQVIK